MNVNNIDVEEYGFWAETFQSEITENYNAYKALLELVSEKEVRQIYLRKIKAEVKEETFQNIKDIKLTLKFLPIQNAIGIFNRQTLVVLVTIIENMLKEFFFCVFCASPEKMYEYIQNGDEKSKGKIDLKEIIEWSSREELLLSLARKAASKVMQGEFKGAIERLKKVTVREKSPNDLLNKIIALNKIRNKIVHELSNTKISFNDVTKAFEVALEMLEYLRKIAKQLEIPVLDYLGSRMP